MSVVKEARNLPAVSQPSTSKAPGYKKATEIAGTTSSSTIKGTQKETIKRDRSIAVYSGNSEDVGGLGGCRVLIYLYANELKHKLMCSYIYLLN